MSPASITQNTPIAATGPRVWTEPTSATSRTSIASVTVMPLARIAGPDAATARCIASCLSSWVRSSSR